MPKMNSILNKIMKEHEDAMPDVKDVGIIHRIPMDSPNLNFVLGGGLPRGRIMTLLGQESGGKSVLASYMGGQIQKQKNIPNVVVYVDIEHTFDRNYASVVGLDTDDDSKFIFVRPKHGEEGFEIVKALAETGEIGLVIWDSVAATGSAKALSKDIGSANFGGTAAVMSEGLKIVNPVLSRHNVPTIFINQVRAKIGGMPSFGPQDNTKVGGYALPFYSSWIAKISRIEDIVDKKEIIGMTMKVKNTKSKIGLPKRSVNLDLYYRTGFNPDMEYINFIIEMGYVQKAGAWLSNEEWGMKVQGRNGLLDYMKKNEDKYEFLKTEINDSFSKFTVLDSMNSEEEEQNDELFLEE
jgi:recombination protein RecA